MPNGQSPVVTTRDQVSFAPNGSIVIGQPTHSGASRVALNDPGRKSKSSRSKFKAPKFVPGAHAIAANSSFLQSDCACGLSRYGVILRPISTTTTKVAKGEHRYMGELFQGIETPKDAVAVRTVKPGRSKRDEDSDEDSSTNSAWRKRRQNYCRESRFSGSAES
jgi:hypothetical protein